MKPRMANSETASTWLLVALGLLSLGCYAAIANQSRHFVLFQSHRDRPILVVLALFGIAFILYLAALFVVHKRSHPHLVTLSPCHLVILGFALAFRLVQVGTNPIQEIDIYRYLWDGRVALAGVNPYAYSPQEIAEGRVASHDVERLAQLRSRPALEQIFQTVHHPEVPTVYPPASQAVFALAAAVTPADLSVQGHVIGMKLVLLLFDLGTIALLVLLLRASSKSALWVLAYAWCPLVVKEVANSGHLDVIAVFFSVLAVLLLVRGKTYAGTFAWGVAILAKFYPLVLMPLVARQLWHTGGWKALIGPLLLCATLVGGIYFLVWPNNTTPLKGLQTFLTEWEMNDALFRGLKHGLHQLMGEEWQQSLRDRPWWPHPITLGDPIEPSFILTYFLTVVALGGFILWLAFRQWSADTFVEGVFYALAVMFLLNPTANPWYLLWSIPFLPWAKQKSWYLLTGLVFLYYLRFWLIYHHPDGEASFHEKWIRIEYSPFYLFFALEMIWRSKWSLALTRRGGT